MRLLGAELSTRPEILARAVAEQAEVDHLDAEGLERMPYLRGCVLERCG